MATRTRVTGYRRDSRRIDNVSGTIKGVERVQMIERYCQTKNICVGDFLTELVDTFFAGEEFRLMSLSKEELVRMVLEGGKA